MTTNYFIQQYENSGTLDYFQMEQIRYGFKMGLSMEQVKLYANPKFKWQQIWEIRDFIKKNNNLPIKTIEFLIGFNYI